MRFEFSSLFLRYKICQLGIGLAGDLKTAKVTPTGFSIDKVDIPAGSHRLVMKVADDTGAAGIKEIKFTVDGT